MARQHVAVVEVAAQSLGRLGGLERLLAHTGDAQSGGQHEPLLRAADADIHAPVVHAEINAGQSADRIDEQQRRMPRGIECLADRGHVAGDAGGGLVLADQHGLDRVRLVGLERRLIAIRRRAFTPFDLEHLDLEPETAAHVDPEITELTEVRGQHAVTWIQAVGDSAASQHPVPEDGKMNGTPLWS